MVTLDSYKKYFDKVISIVLYVENVKTIKTKTNEKMSFLTLSDEYGIAEGVIFPNEYKKIGESESGNVYIFNAKIEVRNNNYQLIIMGIKNI